MGSVDTWVGYWGRLRPDRAAVAANARVVTWKSLAERGGRLAAGLAAEGALRGSRIGVRSRDPLGVIEVIAACARLGTVAVPLDPDSDQDRLRGIVASAELFALLSEADEIGLDKGRAEIETETEMDGALLLLSGDGPEGAVLTHGNVEAVAAAMIAADGLVPPDCVGITLPSMTTPIALAATLGALHAGALIRFGDIAGLLGDADRPQPTVLVTSCEELERPGVPERVAAARPRLVKVPGPVPGALRRECQSRGIPFVEMSGLSLQQSPYLESDELVPLLGLEGWDGGLTILGRRG
ncbi:MAG TPA: AMP-binding protein [Streptosporangiaceae bacterium]|nr:AMP-binding protein [Streptosporangiaceae bacterium]